MSMMQSYTKKTVMNLEIKRRLHRVIEYENSFLLGITEIFSNNLDYIFRYLYIIAFVLQVAIQYSF